MRRYNSDDINFDLKNYLAMAARQMSVKVEKHVCFEPGDEGGHLYHRGNSMASFACMTERGFLQY